MSDIRILYYHRISNDHDDYNYTNVSLSNFKQHMEYICANYTVLKLSELLDKQVYERDEDAVVITFDDGYKNFFDNALPILKQFSIPAACFITTDNIDTGEENWVDAIIQAVFQPSNYVEEIVIHSGLCTYRWKTDILEKRVEAYREIRRIFGSAIDSERKKMLDEIITQTGISKHAKKSKQIMSRDEILRLSKEELIEIGAHTVTHPFLDVLEDDEIDREIIGSKEMLETITERPIKFFAYPFGIHNERIVRKVEEAGIDIAVTCDQGRVLETTDKLRLPRYCVLNYSREEFAKYLKKSVFDRSTDDTSVVVHNSKRVRKDRENSRLKKRKDFEAYTYDYSMKKDWVFPYSEIEAGSDIILYGAGDVGQAYYEQLSNNKFCNIIKWVDKNCNNIYIPGVQILPPSTINDADYDYIVIAIYNAQKAREINSELLKIGVKQEQVIWIGDERRLFRGSILEQRLLDPTETTLNYFIAKRGNNVYKPEINAYVNQIINTNRENDRLIIPRVTVVLSSVCTLKCKHCSNLMPYYDKPQHIPKETVIGDIDKLLGYVDGVISLVLIGGEPFVYPELEEVLVKLISCEKIMNIEITTNGTVRPKTEIIVLLKDSKITVNVSKYEGIENKLNDMLIRNNIRFEERTEEEDKWYDVVRMEKVQRSERKNKLTYFGCTSGYVCKAVLKGRLYQCAVASSLYDIGICNNPTGFIELDNCSKKTIKDFLLYESNPACGFCEPDLWRIVPAGAQICRGV